MSQSSSPPVEHPRLAALQVVRDAAAALRETSRWSMSDDELAEEFELSREIKAMLSADELSSVAEIDARDLGVREATSTAGWLRGRLLVGPSEAKSMVKLALAARHSNVDLT